MADAVLRVAGLSAGYRAGPAIVHDFSLDLHRGEIVALLGTNGAGKSTAARAIAGAIPARSGRIDCAGLDLTGMPSWLAARQGIGYVPQRQNVFEGLTVRDNFGLGLRARQGRRGPDVAWVLELFPELTAQLGRRAGLLSGGLRQMVAVGRALVGAPRVLLLDEPSAGLAGQAARRLFTSLSTLKHEVPILLVEQNVRAALAVADRACVMAGGRQLLTTRPDDPGIAAVLAGELAA